MKFTLFSAVLLSSAALAADAPPALTLADAVQRTLEASPGVEVQRQRVAQAAAGVMSARGQFDWSIGLRYAHSVQRTPAMGAFPGGGPLDPLDFAALNNLLTLIGQPALEPPRALPFFNVQRDERTTFAAGASRQLRNGVSVSPFLSVVDQRTNTASTVAPVIRSDVGVQFVVPLARGLGRAVTTAGEVAAGLGLQASRAVARHEISGRVSRTALAFWDCLSAGQRLELLVDTEKRAHVVVDLVDRLVRSGETEPAQLGEAQAEELRRRSDRLDCEYELVAARQRLGVAIGLDPAALATAPLASGEFPAVSPTAEEAAPALARHALRERGDLAAVGQGRRAVELSLRQARDALLPRLDLDVRAGYAGASEENGFSGFNRALSQNKAGPNFNAGLSLDWPVGNHAARGNFLRRTAELRETELTEAELAAQIAAEVTTACAALRRAAQQQAIAEQTVAALAQVVANQRVKLANGESNLTSVVQNEDRYFQARTSLIVAARNHAVALVELRRVTGTLVDDDARGFRLPLSAFSTPPTVNPE